MNRLLVVGSDAAGMSAALQAMRTAERRGRPLEVVALERTAHTSYSACGIPYWIAGDVPASADLVARTPARLRESGIDLHTGVAATGLDLERGVVTARAEDGDRDVEFGYDQLLLATGSEPIVPAWARTAAGTLVPRVLPVKTIADGDRWLDVLVSDGAPRRCVVVGGGYIGLEMAEALLRRGLEVTLVTLDDEVMASLDPDMGSRVGDQLTAAGLKVLTRTPVTGLTTGPDGAVAAVVAEGLALPADVVVLGMGVTPATAVGADGGLEIGARGGYLPDPTQRVAEGVWAAGDCCEVIDRITGGRVYLPLGTHANKQGRVAGTVIAGGRARYEGALGTAITRFVGGGVHVEIARVGPSSAQAQAAGLDVASSVTEGRTASGYMPEASPMSTKVLAERGSRRLLGLQIVGGPGAGKRVDTAAAAIWGGCTVDDLASMDLAYAPPFATVWEAVQLAARRLADRL